MIAKKWTSIALAISLVFLFIGCGRERTKKTSFEFGKEYFLASEYDKAMIRLEKWIQDNPDTPQAIEAHAMLIVIYHDNPTRQALFEDEMRKINAMGDQGINAILKLMENPTIASRLGISIKSVLVKAGQNSINPLMNAMRGTNPRIRLFAQEVFSEMGPVAVDALISVLNDPDSYVKTRAIESLSQIGDQRAVEALKQKLNDPSKLVQVTAVSALSKMKVTVSTEVIIGALNDADINTRKAAAKAVAEIIENPPLSPLIKALDNPDPDVRDYAAQAIGKTRSPEAIEPLIKVLKSDQVDKVKGSAAKSLEAIGKPVVAPLIALLEKTKDAGTLIRIVQVLGDIGDPSAIKPLEKVYNQATNSLLKNETAKALNKIE